jgi:hypothetical protein
VLPPFALQKVEGKGGHPTRLFGDGRASGLTVELARKKARIDIPSVIRRTGNPVPGCHVLDSRLMSSTDHDRVRASIRGSASLEA